MDKLKVVVLTDNINERVRLKEALNCGEISVWGYVSYEDNAILKIRGMTPDVLLVCYEKNVENLFEICNNIYCSLQGCAIVMMASDPEMDLVTQAVSNGVRQVFPADTPSSELREGIKKASLLEKSRLSDNQKRMTHQSKVIAFFGGKGGTGKTTVAVNTAVALAKEGQKVLIIDCDLQFGDVNLHLDLDPKETISELVQDGSELTMDLIKGFFMLHSSGAYVLCAPKSPEYAEYVAPGHIERIINVVRPYFEYVIVDLPPSFNDVTLSAAENSDRVYLVFGMDISSLKNAKLCMGIFDSLQQKEKLSLIINGVVDSMIKAKDFENMLDIPVAATVCRDNKNAIASLNKGIPLVLSAPKLPISKDLFLLTRRIREIG